MLGDRRSARRPGLTLVIVALGSAAASLAAASGDDALPVEDLTRASSSVLRATVAEVQVLSAGPDGQPGIHTRVLLEASRAMVGATPPDGVVWVPGGTLNGALRVVVGQPSFNVGEEIIVFVTTDRRGHRWPVGGPRAKWRVREERGRARVELAQDFQMPLRERAQPSPGQHAREAYSLEEFTVRVRSGWEHRP